MPASEFGRTLDGVTLNLIVRDVSRSVPFYAEVLGFELLYSDPDFAALRGHGTTVQLHADHTWQGMPWAKRLTDSGPRGLGLEVRILGVDPDAAEVRARELGFGVHMSTRERAAHGWRECYLEDPDGYVFAIGTPIQQH
jgi:catechol 2,3-dioxygenase-like lactoylglutathione lyase family enzyme